MQPLSVHTFYIALTLIISILFIYVMPITMHPFIKAVVGCSFTILIFSIINIKTKTIEELNKIYKRFKLIR